MRLGFFFRLANVKTKLFDVEGIRKLEFNLENNGTDPGGTCTAQDRHSWAQRNNQREKISRNTKNRSAGSFHPNETWQPP